MGALKRWLVLLLLLLILAFGVLFSLQNTAKVPLDLLAVQFSEQPVSLWVIVSFAIGGIVGVVISSVAIVRLKTQALQYQRRSEKLGKELDLLRNAELRGASSLSSGGTFSKSK